MAFLNPLFVKNCSEDILPDILQGNLTIILMEWELLRIHKQSGKTIQETNKVVLEKNRI